MLSLMALAPIFRLLWHKSNITCSWAKHDLQVRVVDFALVDKGTWKIINSPSYRA